MGREVKRVPLNFSWPLEKTWPGFVNPCYRKCPDCDNGYTPAGTALERIVRLLMIAGSDSLWRPADFKPTGLCIEIPTYPGSPHKRLFPHPYLVGAGISDPGPDFHELIAGLTGRPAKENLLGSGGEWDAMKKILAAAGLPENWGMCKTCGGDAIDPVVKHQYEAWEKTEPPAGPGWQMWETVSEGSPISPVFETPERLAAWLAETQASACGHETATYEQWLKMIVGPGWAWSMVHDGKGLRSGVAAVSDE